MPHDERIAEYTGLPFCEAYFEGLLRDTTAVFDSAPPITAVLAAEQLAGRGLELLGRLQTAHYVEGRRISDKDVLVELATEIGLSTEAFVEAFEAVRGEPTHTHIKDSRKLLGQVGGQGFPTLVLELDGRYQVVDFGAFIGKPDAFARWLRAPAQSSNDSAPACGLNGCDE